MSSSWFRGVVIGCVCLGFTGSRVGWADSPRRVSTVAPADYIEDPYAEHKTDGQTARLGTAVGFIYGERFDVLALGLTAAFGRRFGRLTIEGEYAYLGFQSQTASGHQGAAAGFQTVGLSDISVGRGQRLGAIARFDFLRIGPRWIGGNSQLSFYLEGGAAVAWNHWYQPAYDEETRLVPADSKRVEGQAGFGVELEHRLQEPVGFPRRIGWFLGWRVALAPHQSEAASVCRGVTCRAAPMMPEDRYVDRSMLFQSSIAVTW